MNFLVLREWLSENLRIRVHVHCGKATQKNLDETGWLTVCNTDA